LPITSEGQVTACGAWPHYPGGPFLGPPPPPAPGFEDGRGGRAPFVKLIRGGRGHQAGPVWCSAGGGGETSGPGAGGGARGVRRGPENSIRDFDLAHPHASSRQVRGGEGHSHARTAAGTSSRGFSGDPTCAG